MELLEEEKDAEKITVRRIAERANVGIGLINYHFKSKENLLRESVTITMEEMVGKWYSPSGQIDADPVEKLKIMIKELSKFGVQYYKYLKISVSYELLHGSMETPLYLLPVLREIYGREKEERELRLIALQLVAALQSILLRPSAFRMYSGVDIFNDKQRDEIAEILINNLIKIDGERS